MKKYIKENRYIIGVAKHGTKQGVRAFVNDHQPFPKCQVWIEKKLLPLLITCMQIIAFIFFFNLLPV